MRIIIWDTETTDLLNSDSDDPRFQPGITQIAAIGSWLVRDHCDESWTWESKGINLLINPEKPISEEASKITGITDEMVKDCPTLFEAFDEIAEFFRAATHMGGFNQEFDQKVLMANLRRYNLQYNFPWAPRSFDVMKGAKDYLNLKGKRDQKYPNLTELHEALFNEKFANAHDALADVEATWRCAKRLKNEGIPLW